MSYFAKSVRTITRSKSAELQATHLEWFAHTVYQLPKRRAAKVRYPRPSIQESIEGNERERVGVIQLTFLLLV